MRPLFIHIGLHKTGTSFLQRLLHENRDALAAAGLGLAPYQDPRSGSHHPILAAIEAEGPQAVFDTVAAAPGARLLISAEEISQEMNRRPGYLASLHAAAARHFEPHVVIFLRRQDFLKESVYAEAVKGWFSGAIADDHHYDYDHEARLARLEAVFGRARVHVALYRDPGPNDIVGDLLAATGTVLDRGLLRPVPRQNVSMARRKTLLLGQTTKPEDAADDQAARVAPHFVARVLAGSAAVADDGERFLLSPAERHALVAAHAAGNRAIVERYGLAGPEAGSDPFLALPDPDAPWTPPAPISAAEARAVRRACLASALRSRRRNPVAVLRLATQIARLLAPVPRGPAPRPAAASVENPGRRGYDGPVVAEGERGARVEALRRK